MLSNIADRLSELGHRLPPAPKPAANYVPYMISGNMLYISGQIPFLEDGLMTGKLGDDADLAFGVAAAQSCALAILAQANAAVGGDWGKVSRLIKLTGFVNSTADFTQQPTVINGASDLFVEVLGDAGKHVRSAVSAPALPLGVAVEIEAIFELT